MSESQLIEYKESWRDEYLKWICGFANAQGGVLYIGINDKGNAVGVSHAKKLMEDLPNKIRDALGIIAEVNLMKKDGLDVIEISIPSYNVPIFTEKDISEDAIESFKKRAVNKSRIDESVLKEKTHELLKKLHLVNNGI